MASISSIYTRLSFLCLVMFVSHVAVADEADLAKKILADTGVKGGFVVHLGATDGKLTAALRVNGSYQVQGLARSDDNVAKARKHVQSLGVYGDVAIDRIAGNKLPYIDNLVNLIVSDAPGSFGDVTADEMLRVLAPNGVAYVKSDGKWEKIVKPWPDDIDEWTHYLHDATGNAVADDTVVGPPRHLQWLGSPRWSRHHDRMASTSAMVSAGGRVFYIQDEGSRVSIQLPSKWTVIARDAFNGTVLWKQPITKWRNHLWPLKSGPTSLARRLVATKEHVYTTLSIDGPVVALDAATGEIVKTYKESASTEELVVSDGLIFALVNKGKGELADYEPKHNTGDQARVRTEFTWNEKPRQVMAFEAASGRLLWKKESKVAPLTMSGDRERVLFHDGQSVVCLDRYTGDQHWKTQSSGRRKDIQFNFGLKLVIKNDLVFYAGGDRKMAAFDIKTGEEKWSAAHARGGYQSPEDLLIVGDMVWSAPLTSGRDSGVFTGRDMKTGEVKVEFPPDEKTYWFHHRCYIAKATTNFLLPSRTGIEFVDYKTKDWGINHWVRGGCLYGIMPCNGLVYAPPHNCACYPEAKIYGLNALAPAGDKPWVPKKANEEGRLERGPAFNSEISNLKSQISENDWPTYRQNNSRSGRTTSKIATDVKEAWQIELGGRLSTPVVADGKLFITQIDQHLVHALDADSGKTVWSYNAGGRVDSPPTFHNGRLLFGSTDGRVYCLRASDGELIWRFRAAPIDRRHMAMEQLESVWPVHGNILVLNDMAYFVAGRSNFLDGGLRFFRLDVKTGRAITEKTIDENLPGTDTPMQSKIATLQMPVGLTDVLSSDGKYVYMRSQRFDLEGNRQEIGPVSGSPQAQGAAQSGEGVHLFSPTGFLDGTWFHRSYWVYGKSFAGGHSGYHQAGKFAPSGRLLVFDDKNVYGFGRKPQYYKWTTTIEHQLFSADKKAPEVKAAAATKRGAKGSGGPMVEFDITKSLDPTGRPLAVEAWVSSAKKTGVVLARGGPAEGFALYLNQGRPHFAVRAASELVTVSGKKAIDGHWTHLVGVLNDKKEMQLYVNGDLVASGKSKGFIKSDPKQGLEIGADQTSAVGEYTSPFPFAGLIDEVRLYFGTLSADDIKSRLLAPKKDAPKNAKIVLACSFERGAVDSSGNNNHGKITGADSAKGVFGKAIQFGSKQSGRRPKGKKPKSQGGYHVQHHWTKDLPMFVRAMVLADKTLFLVGPPDIMDEEETFKRIINRDAKVKAVLNAQDEALAGKRGAVIMAYSTDGEKLAESKLPSLPVWDGLIAANGRLYMTTADGKVMCLK